jgi:hypothetical protein
MECLRPTCCFTKDASSELMEAKIYSILLQNGPEARSCIKKGSKLVRHKAEKKEKHNGDI